MVAQGQPRRAAQVLGAIEIGREELGVKSSEIKRTEWEKIMGPIRDQIGKEDFARAFGEGRAITLE